MAQSPRSVVYMDPPIYKTSWGPAPSTLKPQDLEPCMEPLEPLPRWVSNVARLRTHPHLQRRWRPGTQLSLQVIVPLGMRGTSQIVYGGVMVRGWCDCCYLLDY